MMGYNESSFTGAKEKQRQEKEGAGNKFRTLGRQKAKNQFHCLHVTF